MESLEQIIENIINEVGYEFNTDSERLYLIENIVKPAIIKYNNQHKKIKYEHFKYAQKCVDFINNNKIKVVSICSSDKYGEGCYLFYEEY